MRVTVLGKSPSWQDADGACSGYLIEDGETRVVLDCGNGVFGKLRRFCDYKSVDAVVLSHLHADHFLDLVPYSYALTLAPGRQRDQVRPRLIAPPGAADTFRRVVGAWGSDDLIEGAFAIEEYDGGAHPQVGGLRFSFQHVPHFTETFAVGVEPDAQSRRFVFGADSGPAKELIEFARGADLLMVEATLREPEDPGDRGHLTPREAGEHGRAAAVGRLVLTHISDELDVEAARAEAERAFGGPVEVAREGAIYSL